MLIFSLGTIRIPWVNRILRRLAGRSVNVLLQLRSRDYVQPAHGVALVIAPHQDDCALGCGGLVIQKCIEGFPVHVVYVTDGSASHPHHPAVTPEMLTAERERESRAALAKMGVEESAVHLLGAADGTLGRLSPEARAQVVSDFRRLLVAIRPDEIFITYRLDGSSEHEAAFLLFTEAMAGTGLQPRVYEYPVWALWNSLRLIRPCLTARRINRFRFRGHEDAKIAVLKCYVSQFEPTPPWPEPVIDPDFVRLFQQPCEFFLEI